LTRLKVKGVPFLLDTAKRMTDVRFILVGPSRHLLPHLRADAPPNVEIVPYVEQDELLAFYQRAKVYCQPSYSEGLPNALCEAMLCECIPVGTAVGGIPTAMQGIGFLVPYGDVHALVEAITQALAAPSSVGHRARAHIAENFTLSHRENALLRTLHELSA
jgi:glycosyltransferase involved in cell wall biosynthesis